MKKSHLRAVGIACAVSTEIACLGLASVVAAGPAKTDLGLIAGAMQLVQRGYVHPVDSSQLTDDALKGMLSRLDPHSKVGSSGKNASAETASPPIKEQFIGTSQDAQLAAALNLLRPPTPNSAAVGGSAS